MNELAGKLADLLDVTTKAAIDLYPVMREQFLWYGALDSIKAIVVVLLVITLPTAIFIALYLSIEEAWGFEDWKNNWKSGKWLVIAPVTVMVVLSIIDIVSYITAPDIMIVMELLNK